MGPRLKNGQKINLKQGSLKTMMPNLIYLLTKTDNQNKAIKTLTRLALHHRESVLDQLTKPEKNFENEFANLDTFIRYIFPKTHQDEKLSTKVYGKAGDHYFSGFIFCLAVSR